MTNDPYVDPLDILDRVIKGGDDPWETMIELGISSQKNMDEGRWIIGDIANLVRTKYGDDRIGQFAKHIGVEVARVKQYRTVARFWEKSTRVDFLEECPTLTYSHMRLAMAMETLEAASAFLLECADNAWTIEKANIELRKRLGKPTPPRKLFDSEVCIQDVGGEKVLLVLQPAPDTVNVLAETWRDNKPVRLVLYEVLDWQPEPIRGDSHGQ